jgi:outer membrane biosynthesis protein TonB
MILVITDKGKVSEVEIVCGPSTDIDRKVAAATRDWTFSPAGKDGKPLMVKVRVDSHI